MKTLLVFLLAANMYGNVSIDYISTFYYEPSVTISFENWNKSDLSVKIMTKEGELVYNDRLDTKKADGIKYNLRNLSSGKYNIILENNSKKVVETIILFDGKIVEKDAKVYFKPVIEIQGNKLRVNFLSYNGIANVTIYNKEDIVYTERFNDANPLNKVFDLSNLDNGKYTVVVTNDFTSKSQNFQK